MEKELLSSLEIDNKDFDFSLPCDSRNKATFASSYKPKKKRVVKEKKTILPPCNICGSTATGYKKCESEGMSKTRIKVGRYSREIHQKNREALRKLYISENSSEVVPLLLKYTDADDITTKFSILLDDLRNINWSERVSDLNEIFDRMKYIIETGLFLKDDFTNILEVTGLHIDNRKEFSKFNGKLMEISGRYWLPFLKALPGMIELDDRVFFHILCSHLDAFHLIISLEFGMKWQRDGLHISLNNKSICLSNENLERMIGNSMTDLRHKKFIKMEKANLTNEEILFIFSINMVTPNEYYPYFPSAYDRVSQALTRYLQKTYGDSYHYRLSELISFLSFFNELKVSSNRWREDNRSCFEHVFDTPFSRIFCAGFSNEIDKNMDVLSQYIKNP
ncbi:DgyrCDS10209 [Dimorphilus gyrociliatus]|uniref:DgyrCDS10209 n=1 Tax=Dimorphilus gyrociliatus TaxID=2664684 RepID=A0A7I8W243_9ANNE|nr:DgyrCDS10209 [Dimorphilus gyrociliatus]